MTAVGRTHLVPIVAAAAACVLAFAAAAWAAEPAAAAPGIPALELKDAQTRVESGDLAAIRLAITDLVETGGGAYPKGKEYLDRLAAIEKSAVEARDRKAKGDAGAAATLASLAKDLAALRREALLANPLLDFDRLILVKRGAKQLGLPQNWQSNSSLPQKGYDNEIAALSVRAPQEPLKTLFRPAGGEFVGDVDLHFDGDRMLFSMPAAQGRWQVFEVRADGTALRQVTRGDQSDVDSYDACYLPNGKIAFCSTAVMNSVPCTAGDHVAVLYLMDEQGGGVRQLTFEQDHDWCPTVLPTGQLMYLRWEYSDLPHAFSRILFRMNPDGTEQMALYGSNSYWPNGIFYARPIPGHPTQVAGIVTGHHGVPRMGELVIFDPARGQHEAGGVVQRIPGYGKKVEAVLSDNLVDASWPKFLHPFPLSTKCFLVSAKPTAEALWGIYLVDIYDNMICLREDAGYALLEPVPLRPTPRPPAVPDRVDLARQDGTVYVADVYAGEGLKGVPRGTVKQLRVYTYHFSYHGLGGQYQRVGLDGPWDIKRVIGTVPVEEDGSAMFRVPANTPIAVQPLDAEGKAVQFMRSWMTAMPGEVVSCVGCHEKASEGAPNRATVAAGRAPSEIKPWYGPMRGFAFQREVQPVLDKYCVGCHNGSPRPDGQTPADLRSAPLVNVHPIANLQGQATFTPSYYALRRFVRAPTMESDIHLLPPCEYHADTSQLVQMLRKGHHGVTLDAEAWDRIITWIDLGSPCHGTWGEFAKYNTKLAERRRTLLKLYANRDDDPEAVPPAAATPVVQVMPPPEAAKPPAAAVECPGWPFDAAEAARRQAADGPPARTVDLGGGVALELVRIPAGEFVMGDPAGAADEQPATRVRIDRPFFVGKFEVTNEQFGRFDPWHDSRIERGHFLQFSERERGYPLDGPRQPVVRVSWQRAMAFARWLSQKTGEAFSLPTEAQWEYACRAGTATPLWYGGLDADFSASANLADATFQRMEQLGWNLPYGAVPPWQPAETRFNDKSCVSAPVGTYKPNPWGLHDMHGNVWEWTRSAYRPYPYRADDGREAASADGEKVVRGGSWYDRPLRGRSAFRLSYPAWEVVYNVGFRLVLEPAPERPVASASRN